MTLMLSLRINGSELLGRYHGSTMWLFQGEGPKTEAIYVQPGTGHGRPDKTRPTEDPGPFTITSLGSEREYV